MHACITSKDVGEVLAGKVRQGGPVEAPTKPHELALGIDVRRDGARIVEAHVLLAVFSLAHIPKLLNLGRILMLLSRGAHVLLAVFSLAHIGGSDISMRPRLSNFGISPAPYVE